MIVAGVQPRRVVEPASVDEAAAFMTESAGRREALVFAGGGTELELGAPPRRLDAVVRTTKLDRLVEHAPSDQIATVEAGMTLAALQAALAGHGQRLALDPPLPARATIGGIVAANACGPLRTRHGGVRDLIIGASFLRADGGRVKGGGKVVKNVAGFDLPKLLVGSLGTLGLITTVTFRLHPLPEARETLLLGPLAPRAVWELSQRLRQAQLEPAALAATGEGEGRAQGDDQWRLAVRYEGFGGSVSQQRARTVAIASEQTAAHRLLDAPAAEALWRDEAALRAREGLRVKIAAPPSALAALYEKLGARLAGTLAGLRSSWYPLTGLSFLSAAAGGLDVAAAAALLGEARTEVEAAGGSLTIAAAPPPLRERIDVWGSPPPALALMRRIKERFDPEGRLAPGRFVGGI
jgi:glycolate oxidase FAD binding subunit